MKLVYRNLARNGPGSVKLVPEEEDDLWHAYNLIVPGDTLQSVTVRKVLREMASGGRDAERVRLKLEIVVESVDYDKEGSVLRVRGKNITENDHVKIGQFHTVELELKRQFTLTKAHRGVGVMATIGTCQLCGDVAVALENSSLVGDIAIGDIGGGHGLCEGLCRLPEERLLFLLLQELWDWLALDTIQQACDPTASADLAVILMQEGLAHLFLIGRSYGYLNSITVTRARIETSIPRKHGPAIAGYESALKKFFEHVLQAFLKHIDFEVVQCAVIASPGFTKDQFRDYMHLEAARRDLRLIIENKQRIVLAHAPSGYKHSLKEVLDSPSVMTLIKDTKAAQEVQALKDFFNMLTNDSARACYGPKHVEIANERLAIQTLLITDNLFRNSDIATRQNYVRLVESVKKFGGTVHIFSSMHVSGEQLAQLTGIAAILRFPLPDLEDIEM
uniref:Putative pelota n=1 Tax=Oryza sativa subsp. japonica TaxID=39947 RepID=Q8S3N8_ORYSJ|nr:putative pelota [Oryza sativa Japonica Group]